MHYAITSYAALSTVALYLLEVESHTTLEARAPAVHIQRRLVQNQTTRRPWKVQDKKTAFIVL